MINRARKTEEKRGPGGEREGEGKEWERGKEREFVEG